MHSTLKACFRRPVPGRGSARAFDRRKLFFSEKLTAMTVNAYLPVQRVYLGHCSVSLGLGRENEYHMYVCP